MSPPSHNPDHRRSRRDRHDRRVLVLLLAASVAWGSVFIARTSFDMFGERYFVLFDDAMISMAYARNVVAGHGLVWSPGSEPVEGFTNPLWTAAMALAHLLPLAERYRSAAVQVLGLVLLAVTVWRVRALLRAHFPGAARSPSGWWPAAVLTAFCYPLAYWSLFGMETALQALLAVLAVHLAYDVVFAGRDRHVALFAVFALAYLVRMDMAVLVFVVGGWMALHGGLRRRAWRRWALGAALLLLAVAGYQAFRVAYFGEWLPNTYHLKLGDVPLDLRLPRGAASLWESSRATWALWLGALVALVTSRGRPNRQLLPALLVGAYAAYSVWVGGDAWELTDVNVRINRFLVFVVPLAAVLVNDALTRWTATARPAVRRATVAIATVAVLLVVDGLAISPRAGENWRRALLIERPLYTPSHALVLSNLRAFEELVEPGAEVVTYWAGIPAYFSDYRLIDAMGYTDPHIARAPLPADLPWQRYTPGHLKRDLGYLMSRRPDAFFQFWDLENLPARWPRHFMRRSGYVQVGEPWLRRDSPYLRPGVLPAHGAHSAGAAISTRKPANPRTSNPS